MNRIFTVAQLVAVCFSLLLMAACGGGEEDTTATPTGAVSEGTPASPQPTSPSDEGTPFPVTETSISARGEAVERLANTVLQHVTWEDGTTYEETISDLVFRTAGKPDAGHGHRVVARWLSDTNWQVIIYMRVVDRSTDPETVTDLTGQFYYDEETDEFTAANGRAVFALTGRDPCLSDQPQPDYCPLDEEVSP